MAQGNGNGNGNDWIRRYIEHDFTTDDPEFIASLCMPSIEIDSAYKVLKNFRDHLETLNRTSYGDRVLEIVNIDIEGIENRKINRARYRFLHKIIEPLTSYIESARNDDG